MNSAHELLREVTSRPSHGQHPLASWYMQGRSDGVGDRLLMHDNTGGPSLELLRFRPELSAAPGFERALRARVERLEQFEHRAFPAVRAVEHLDDGEGLALVSTYVSGTRLAEMLSDPRVAGFQPVFATSLIRQLTPALAQLQRQGEGIAHGLLNADRVLLTAEGSLVILEHALGGAFDHLRLSSAQLWTDFGVIAPADDAGTGRLDRQTDVIQLGLLALSVLLGRSVTPAEYPARLGLLLDELAEISARRSPAQAASLCLWLERALRPGDRMFASAEEAHYGLKELPDHFASTATDHARSAARALPGRGAWRQVDSGGSQARPELEETNMQNTPAAVPDFGFASSPDDDESGLSPFLSEAAGGKPAGSTARREHRSIGGSRLAWSVAAVFALLTLVEAVALARSFGRASAMPVGPVPIVVDSPRAGDLVLVDGRVVGTTPLNLAVGTNVHSLWIASQSPAAVEVPAGPAAETRPDPGRATDEALTAAAARQRSGGVKISSPIELKVLEGERVLGSTADGPIVTTAGSHDLDLINSAFGFRTRQTVTISAGKITALTVKPPDGRLNVNASPWAQVSIDGAAAGDTPLANISLPVGEHEIVFRHPQLGEHRETIVVRAGSTTRVSATLGR